MYVSLIFSQHSLFFLQHHCILVLRNVRRLLTRVENKTIYFYFNTFSTKNVRLLIQNAEEICLPLAYIVDKTQTN
ncbi:hypothetical protein [Neobacillus massiliamazoniensis]|uniref:hypothetical protein n=1 Tax=Neobacillus massiliamazoniensis TaxID=1499688 RepID=UPI003CCC1235